MTAPVQVRLRGPFELVIRGGMQRVVRQGERALLAVLALSVRSIPEGPYGRLP